MNYATALKHSQNLKDVIEGIKRLEMRCNPDEIHGLGSLYATKAGILEALNNDPLEQTDLSDEEIANPSEMAGLRGEIEGLRAIIDAMPKAAKPGKK